MPEAIVVERVGKHYPEGAGFAHVLRDCDLRIETGEFVSLIGPSGSGKSTLLALVAGLEVPDAGRVRLAGRALEELSEDERSDLRLRRVGMVFQSFNLLPTFTVLENVAWPLEFSGVGDAAAHWRPGVGRARQRPPRAAAGGTVRRRAAAGRDRARPGHRSRHRARRRTHREPRLGDRSHDPRSLAAPEHRALRDGADGHAQHAGSHLGRPHGRAA